MKNTTVSSLNHLLVTIITVIKGVIGITGIKVVIFMTVIKVVIVAKL